MDLRPFMERWGMLPPSGGTMLVAVSGGRDSVCLLHYLATMPRDFSVAAAHLDHGQRPTAGRDVAFVRQLCRELDVPLTVERADVPALARQRGVGLEEAGRMARYDFFRRTADSLGAQRIATASASEPPPLSRKSRINERAPCSFISINAFLKSLAQFSVKLDRAK